MTRQAQRDEARRVFNRGMELAWRAYSKAIEPYLNKLHDSDYPDYAAFDAETAAIQGTHQAATSQVIAEYLSRLDEIDGEGTEP